MQAKALFFFCAITVGCGGGGASAPDAGGGGGTPDAGGGGGGTPDAGGGGGGGTPDAGVTHGGPKTLAAKAVGGWLQTGASCTTTFSGYAFFLCPGGFIRGAGMLGNTTNLECGTYSVTPRVYQNCGDRVGCFDNITATTKSTLILAGQSDVKYGFVWHLYQHDADNMIKLATCSNGSDGYLVLQRVTGTVTDDDCASSACPKPGGGAGWGSCGTDCDCGTCWYCESGTCRYGGQGPYGCYRGCQP